MVSFILLGMAWKFYLEFLRLIKKVSPKKMMDSASALFNIAMN